MTRQVPLFINGEFVTSSSAEKLPVTNPANQQLLAEVPFATHDEVEAAVASAKEAFKTWKDTPVMEELGHIFAREELRCAVLIDDAGTSKVRLFVPVTSGSSAKTCSPRGSAPKRSAFSRLSDACIGRARTMRARTGSVRQTRPPTRTGSTIRSPSPTRG